MNKTLGTKSTKNKYFEKSKEEIKDQMRNLYHQEGEKKRKTTL